MKRIGFSAKANWSRRFSKKEVDYFSQAIRAWLKAKIPQGDRRVLSDLLGELEHEGRLPELPPLVHPHRAASFVLLTLLLPEAWRGGPAKVSKSQRGELRAGIKAMLQETFGSGFVIGFRFSAHQGRQRGFHVHVILSLLRFPRELEQDAAVFVARDKEAKARVLPYFFQGPHIDPATIQPMLVRPYAELLREVLGAFEGDITCLVHVEESWDRRQTARDRERVNNYLSRRWKVFDNIKVRGYYRGDRGSEVLLEQCKRERRRFRASLSEFVRGYLLNKCKIRFRRGSIGFHHGRHRFAAVVDFAARQPHPHGADRRFLDQSPDELASLAARSADEIASALAVDGFDDTGGVATMKAKTKRLFPADRLPEMLESWPFTLVDFNLPMGLLESATLPVAYEKACKGVVEIIRGAFEKGAAKIGYVVVPASTGGKLDGRLAVRAFLSQIAFNHVDSDLVQDFLRLPEAEQGEFVAAFYRHPALILEPDRQNELQTAWSVWASNVDKGHSGVDARVRVGGTASILETVRTTGPIVEPRVCEQVLAATLEGNGKSYRYRLPDGAPSTWFKSLETLGRHLDGRISLIKPRAFGFFHNKSYGFGHVARLGIGRDLDELRAEGETALYQLCDRLEVDPATFARKTITDHLGNAAADRDKHDEQAA